MASLWDYVVGGAETQESATRDAATAAQLHETLIHQQGFKKHVSALATRTALSPEDVMAEAVRFAERHQEAFHDFIYKGNSVEPERQTASGGRINTIVAMMFLLGVLIALIVLMGSR
jgi:hypothetical protein